MRQQNESFGELLFKAPWWISTTIGVLAFAALRWGVPAWAGSDNSWQPVAKGIPPLAPLLLLFFGIIAAGSFWFGKYRRRLVDQQTSLESLRATPWKKFEFLVAEAFRRQGYQVEFSLNRGADGGVDLILRKEGRTSLVQCKQWKVFSVGVPVVREMFGLMTAERAHEALIVTSGKFTRAALDFVAGKPIRLIDGPELLTLIQTVQPQPVAVDAADLKQKNHQQAMSDRTAPVCPRCGKSMVLRIAQRGPNAGNQFWGCSAFPACKGTLNFSPQNA